VSAPYWNRNVHYHALIVSAMPAPCGAALDVGCGAGALLVKLAERAERDPDMTYTEVERVASKLLPGVEFRRLLLCRYLLTWTKPA
jgi:tRNA G46 methylase TrmB